MHDKMIKEGNYIEGGEPIIIENDGAKAAIVCLHGFCATPYEIKPVAKALGNAGFHVVGPAIPGHAIAPEEKGLEILSKLTYEGWIEAIEAIVEDLSARYDKIFLYGQSMGGALALAVATSKKVAGVAVTGAAIRLQMLAHVFGPILSIFNKNFKRSALPGSPPNVTYDHRPSKAIYQLILLGKHVRRHLHEIECPILVVHSAIDDTVPIKVPDIIKKKATRADVKIKWFNESSHVYTLDLSAGAIIGCIKAFFLGIS